MAKKIPWNGIEKTVEKLIRDEGLGTPDEILIKIYKGPSGEIIFRVTKGRQHWM